MRYRKPSILEALCELHFDPEGPWDLTVFGRFAEQVQPELPVKEELEILSASFAPAEGGLAQRLDRVPRMRFYTKDKDRLAQLSPHLAVANVTTPYPHWGPFRDFILRVYRAYRGAAAGGVLTRVLLRYIDRLAPPSEAFRLGDWLATDAPVLPPGVRDAELEAEARFLLKQGPATTEVSLVLSPVEGRPIITLDSIAAIDFSTHDEPILEERLDELHGRTVGLFESCISDRTREYLVPEGASRA